MHGGPHNEEVPKTSLHRGCKHKWKLAYFDVPWLDFCTGNRRKSEPRNAWCIYIYVPDTFRVYLAMLFIW